jgi:hypothetical protein
MTGGFMETVVIVVYWAMIALGIVGFLLTVINSYRKACGREEPTSTQLKETLLASIEVTACYGEFLEKHRAEGMPVSQLLFPKDTIKEAIVRQLRFINVKCEKAIRFLRSAQHCSREEAESFFSDRYSAHLKSVYMLLAHVIPDDDVAIVNSQPPDLGDLARKLDAGQSIRERILKESAELEAELASVQAELVSQKLSLETERDPVFGKSFLS